MTEPFNTDLYDQRIDAMKARERRVVYAWGYWEQAEQDERNIERLAAYKRKRAAWALEGPLS